MRVYIGVPGKGGLTTVGEALRQAREARGISLENARGATGIPLHYLQAMESGDSKLIADEFYLIPFFRRYAQYLELDPAATVAQFLNDSQHLEDARPSFEPPRKSRRRMVGMVAVLLVLLAIAVAGWALFARRHGLAGSAAAQKIEPVQSSSRASP
ncbi:MAG TPA: helix-turn-helix domain-containing protein [Candidatus Bathyarchaeia archaeon]|nr:helix-turn-helix domain-containing protein [Candidatus Bathyarchaeia archaeon]